MESWKSGSLENYGEGLVKAVNGWNGDGAAGDSRVMEQIRDERGWQEWHISGEKNDEARGGGLQRGTNPGQWSQARPRIGNDRRIRGERRVGGRVGPSDRRRKTSRTQCGERMRDERPAAKGQERLIAAHAARLPAGEDKACRVRLVCWGQSLCHPAQ